MGEIAAELNVGTNNISQLIDQLHLIDFFGEGHMM